MDIIIEPSALGGTVDAPSSKSDAHRLLICAAMADAPTKISFSKTGADIEATINCLRAMGAKIEYSDGVCSVEPIDKASEMPFIDCGESGSTLRFLLPVVSAVCGGGSFSGSGRLPSRPLDDLTAVMKRGGVSFSSDALPFQTSGHLRSGEYSISGNVSSQYISGLLMALPMLEADSKITLTSSLESAAYVQMTLKALRRFGIEIKEKDNTFEIKGGQKPKSPGFISAEGDWSNSAFFLVGGALGNGVSVSGLDEISPQGDSAVSEILRLFGASTQVTDSFVRAGAGALSGQVVDVSEIPDLLPILAVLAAFSDGETRFINAARLRLKESDRLKTTAEMLRGIGAQAQELEDSLVVHGGRARGGETQSANDHRIAMASAIAAAYCEGPTIIRQAEAVNKSYPAFFEDFSKLGGKYRQL